jgi:hypothetical protein
MAPLAPLSEEPISEVDPKSIKNLSSRTHSFKAWITNHLSSHNKADLRILLSVVGCPLSPVPVLPSPPRNVSILSIVLRDLWLYLEFVICMCPL